MARIVCFGELLVRLTAPAPELLLRLSRVFGQEVCQCH